MARPNNQIDEELVCIDSVVHVLSRTLGLTVGAPTRVRPGTDPPDFWLRVGDNHMPVEVTSIVQKADFDHQAGEMAKTLKERSLNANALHGTYALAFRGLPRIPHPKRKQDSRFYELGLDYISRTTVTLGESELNIVDDAFGQIVIRKVSEKGATVAEMITRTEWGGESQEKVRDLLDSAAEKKIEKLRKNGHVGQDAILALYDAYAFITFNEVVECTADLPSLSEFAGVYWASAVAQRENYLFPGQPGYDGGFIASQYLAWVGAKSVA